MLIQAAAATLLFNMREGEKEKRGRIGKYDYFWLVFRLFFRLWVSKWVMSTLFSLSLFVCLSVGWTVDREKWDAFLFRPKLGSTMKLSVQQDKGTEHILNIKIPTNKKSEKKRNLKWQIRQKG